MSDALVLRPAGERAVLVELGDNAGAQRLARHVRARLADRVQEVVPGHVTVLIVGIDEPIAVDELAGWEQAPAAGAETAEPLEIPVRYDGEDLEAVARGCRMSPEEVVRRHCAAQYTVAFLGFAPGFAYLIGGDSRLRPGRRDAPRERVPAGAVAIAGDYSAVYPRASPGGWQLIGRTETRMFDAERDPPALAIPGAHVAFRASA